MHMYPTETSTVHG